MYSRRFAAVNTPLAGGGDRYRCNRQTHGRAHAEPTVPKSRSPSGSVGRSSPAPPLPCNQVCAVCGKVSVRAWHRRRAVEEASGRAGMARGCGAPANTSHRRSRASWECTFAQLEEVGELQRGHEVEPERPAAPRRQLQERRPSSGVDLRSARTAGWVSGLGIAGVARMRHALLRARTASPEQPSRHPE